MQQQTAAEGDDHNDLALIRNKAAPFWEEIVAKPVAELSLCHQ